MTRGEEWKRGDIDDTKALCSKDSGLRVNDGHEIILPAHFACSFSATPRQSMGHPVKAKKEGLCLAPEERFASLQVAEA